MARLAVAAPLSSMVRAIWVAEIIALRRRVLVMIRTAGILHMTDAGLFLPDIRLVRVGVDMRDDWGRGVSGRVGPIGCVALSRVG